MTTLEAGTRVNLNDILFLTDFSAPSEAALPFAMAIARAYSARLHALHILLPVPLECETPESTVASIEAAEEHAQIEMQRLESHFAGLSHDTNIERGIAIWPSIQRAIQDEQIDFIVLGTHGRTGARKLLLGSVAEEIFRRSPVPVLTIGPGVRSRAHNDARFHRVLYATDFSPHSLAAWPYAISLAQENQAHLMLLHSIPDSELSHDSRLDEILSGHYRSRLAVMLPKEAELWCHPETLVEKGDPAARILEVSKQHGADLIVLGVRSAAGLLGPATHLERAVAHRVVAHAQCPVLTVRGSNTQTAK